MIPKIILSTLLLTGTLHLAGLQAQNSLVTKAALEFNSGFYESALTEADKAVANPGSLKPKQLAKAYAIIGKSLVSIMKDSSLARKYPDAGNRAFEAFQNVRKHDESDTYAEDIKPFKLSLAQNLLLVTNDNAISGNCDAAITAIIQSETLFNETGIKIYNVNLLKGFAYLCKKTPKDSLTALTEFENSIKIYNEVLKDPKTNPQYKENLQKDTNIPMVYSKIIYMLATTKKDLDQAMALLESVKPLYPEHKDIQEIEFYLLQNPTLITKAVNTYEAKHKANPNDAGILIKYASLMEQKANADKANNLPESEIKKSYDKSIDLYTKAVTIEPQNAIANFNLGVLYVNRAAEIDKKMNDLPTDKQNEYNALDKEKSKNITLALPYLEKSFEVEPKNVNTLRTLVNIYTVLGNLDKIKLYKSKLEALDK